MILNKTNRDRLEAAIKHLENDETDKAARLLASTLADVNGLVATGEALEQLGDNALCHLERMIQVIQAERIIQAERTEKA